MALIDKASLLMVPSTYEAGTLYNVLPSGNRAPDSTDQNSGYDQTRADFTFDRGSNAAATRVNSDGLIEKYRENKLLQSNQFDTTWTESGSNDIVSSGQSGYDGTNDAWQLEHKGSQYTSIRQTISTSGVQTYSVYAKAGTLDYVVLYAGAPRAWFDVKNGVVGFTSSVIHTSIEAVSGAEGWYRCSMVFNASATTARIYPNDASGTFGTATGTVFIQNAQAETGLVATDYLDSGATTAKAGVLIDLPRINYDANGENGALLLEPQRTNLFDYSEYASGNSLVGSPTITENYAVSPDGTQNAFQVDSASGGSFKRIRKILSVSANSTYTCSYFIKKATSAVTTFSGIGMVWQNGTQKVNYIIVDEYNGTMSILQDQTNNTATKVDDYGTYWRFSVSATDIGSNTSFESAFYGCLSTNGTSVGLGAKTWVGYGFQVEAGSYVSSYIPNHGESGGVTRAADSCSVTGASDVIPNEGVFYIDMSISGFEDYTSFFQLSEGANTTIRFWGATYSGSAGLFGQIYVQGVDVKRQLLTATKNERIKAAIRYDSGNIAFYVNGSEVYSGTETFTPEALTLIDNFKVFTGDEVKNGGSVYGLGVFPVLTNAELATLTTL